MYTQCWIVGAIIKYCTHLPAQETTRLHDIIIHEDSDCFFFCIFLFPSPVNRRLRALHCFAYTSKIYTRRRIYFDGDRIELWDKCSVKNIHLNTSGHH